MGVKKAGWGCSFCHGVWRVVGEKCLGRKNVKGEEDKGGEKIMGQSVWKGSLKERKALALPGSWQGEWEPA